MATSLPMGSGLTPGENTNWRKPQRVPVPQLAHERTKQEAGTHHQKRNYEERPRPVPVHEAAQQGEVSDPMAAKDREALTAERDQPKASSKGSTKRPKA